MGTSYSKPRKLNIVSFLVLLLAVAAIYGAIKFGPAYYRRWKIQGVLSEAANAMYPRRMATGYAASTYQEEISQKTIAKLRQEGVADPGLRIFISARRDEIKVRAAYSEQVVHPFVDRTTILRFAPEYVMTVAELDE